MKRGEEPYRNASAAPAKPKAVPVIAPRPTFASADEAIAYRAAVESTPRAEGEELIDWLARVSDAARSTTVERGEA